MIRTDTVRYPGLDIPGSNAPMRSGLGPVRDAGFALGEGRRERGLARKRQVRRQRLVAALVLIAFAALVSVGFKSAYDANAGRLRAKVRKETTPSGLAGSGFLDPRPGASLAIAAPKPTPVFAGAKGVELRLPVPPIELTEIGFHQAARTYALHMKTALPDADGQAARGKGTGRDADHVLNSDGTLNVSVLRMWRPRPGKPDSAADVGAAAGTVVYAPVDGQVVKVKKYKLYGRCDDYEIHIKPTGRDDIDVVLIHVDKVAVRAGDEVRGGLTQVGVVRKLYDKTHHQLADYMSPTEGKGDHVHIQLNNTRDPEYKGLEGAIDGS